MRKYIIGFLLSIIVYSGFSQKYLPGYILTLKGDTIYGELLKRHEFTARNKCIFKKGQEKNVTYLPNEISGYRFENGSFYVSKNIEIEGKLTSVFLEYLLNGIIKLYYYPTSDKELFYINKNDTLIELVNNKKVVYKDGIKYEKYDKKYIGTLRYLYSDVPELINKVENLNFTSNSLINISEEYHNSVCNEYDCIVYKRKDRKIPWGVSSHLSYKFTQVNIDVENLTTHIIEYNANILENASYSNRYNSNYSYSYGLGITVLSWDRRFKLEYSFYKEYNNFLKTQHYNLLSYYDNFNTLLVKKLCHQVNLDFSFTYSKVTPYISIGLLLESLKESNISGDTKIFLPEQYLGYITELGVKYYLKERMFFELSAYYSSSNDAQSWSQRSNNTLYESLMEVNFTNLGLNLNINILLNK